VDEIGGGALTDWICVLVGIGGMVYLGVAWTIGATGVSVRLRDH
jgi:hypothetical protein